MTVDELKQAQFAFSGIDRWHNAGYTGKGVVVWNRESNSGHGASTRSVIEKVAPEATILSASINASFGGDKMLDCNVGGKPVEDFIRDNKVKVISSSISGDHNAPEFIKLWKNLVAKYNLVIFNSAGNDSDEGTTSFFPYEHSIQVGAVELINGTVKSASYSSVGNEVDFTNFTLWFRGTSFACPYTAGMGALLIGRYGDLTQEEVYQMLKRNAVDLGSQGKDNYFGWGVARMPDANSKYITLTIGSNVMKVNGQNMFLDTEPIIDSNGRTLVPVRAIAEALGCEVGWIPSEQKVIITRV